MEEVTNLQRAAWAQTALEAFASVTGMECEDDQTRLADLLADLMHFCKLYATREDSPMSFDNALDTEQS